MAEPLRMDFTKIAPDVYKHLLQMEGLIAAKLDRKLLHLIKMRASQINGCAYCIGMHTDEALRDGESPERPADARRVEKARSSTTRNAWSCNG